MSATGELPEGAKPADPRRDVRVWLLGALTVACAFRAYLFFQTDEHFSIIEYTSLKLGVSRAEQLSWEYRAAIRPWLQPAIYLVLAKLGGVFGVESRFVTVAIFRLFTGVAAVTSFVGLVSWSKRSEASAGDARPSFPSPYLLPFLPYLFTRTSAEALSATCLACAWLAYFPRGLEPFAARAANHRGGARSGLLAGLLLGLAFDVRPQTAIFAVGLLVWTLLNDARPRAWWAALAAGGAVAIALLLVIDRWGYGYWVVTPYRYFVVNLVEGKAASYGTKPFYAYAYLLLENPFALTAAYALLVMVVAMVRHRRHPLTWSVGAFVIVHSILAHKEDRFLFPIVPFLAVLVPMAFSPPRPGSTRARRGLTALRRFGYFGYAVGAIALAVQIVEPYGNANTGLAREIERWGRDDVPVVVVESLDRTIARQPFYERRPWLVVGTGDPIPSDIAGAPLAHVVAYDVPLAPGECPSPKLRGRCTRRWSEFRLGSAATHDGWLARAEAAQEYLRVRFAPSSPSHPSWYAVFDFVPEAPSPGP